MEQYIPKSALLAEIEKRLDELWDLLPNALDVVNDNYTKEEANITGKYTTLESFRDYINTLEVKDTWKPTDEQLEALEWSLGDYRNVIFEERHDTLVSLYNNLKKLKGE